MKQTTLLVLFKHYIKRYILTFYFNNYRFKKVKVLSRHACLGQEVLGRLELEKCSLKYENLFSISVDDKFILDACKSKVDNFAYHYCDTVYQAYVKKIQSLNILKEIQNV